jgi:DNA-binding transcriptional MerR regulator
MSYTIKEIADLAGVTTRTLRYYDQIGLFCPSGTGQNGYRYYDQESLLRLQQILFFRELDVPLKEIQRILNRPGFDLQEALQEHRRALRERARRLEQLLHTVDKTIDHLQGKGKMSAKDYFEGFDESVYEDEAHQRGGDTSQWAESQRKWSSYSPDQREAIKQEGGRITRQMVGAGAHLQPDDPDVQAAVGAYYAYLNQYFYTCPVSFLRNLADMWVEDPRFAINYERIREGGAAFVREAVHIYCDRHK